MIALDAFYFAVAYGWILLVWLIHERGHAKAAEVLTRGPVVISIGCGPNVLLPVSVSRRLGLSRTLVVIGIIARRGGYTGRDPISDRDELLGMYSAGYRATWRAAGVVALLDIIAIAAAFVWPVMAYVAGAGGVGVVLLVLDSFIQQNVKKDGPGFREGSDAHVLARLRVDSRYRPVGGVTAQALLAEVRR